MMMSADTMMAIIIDNLIHWVKELDNKLFRAQLDKIITDKNDNYELNKLCRYVHDTANLFGEEYEDDETQERQEFVLRHYDTAVHAVKKATSMKENKTRLPPCRMCGHPSVDLFVSSVMDDDFMDDADIHTKCHKCQVVFILMKLW